MIKPLLSLTFILLLIGVLISGNSSGAAATQGADRTGSPLSAGSCGLAGCHDDGAFNPTLELSLLEGGTPVASYEPGKSYRLRVAIRAGDGTPGGYGFQAVALTGDDNAGAGTFGNLPSGVQLVTLRGRTYVEQSRRLNAGTIEFDWQAPAAGGAVRFYAVGNAVNGNGSSIGDGVAVLPAPLTVSPVITSRAPDAALAVDWSLWPNPTADRVELRLQGAAAGAYRLTLLDAAGRTLAEHTLRLDESETREQIDLTHLPPGLYLLRLSDGRRTAARRIVKN